MPLRSCPSSGASDSFRGAAVAASAPEAAPAEAAFEAPASDFPMPNCPDMKTCAAVASWDFSCWPRSIGWAPVVPALVLVELVVAELQSRGNYMHCNGNSSLAGRDAGNVHPQRQMRWLCDMKLAEGSHEYRGSSVGVQAGH